MRPRGSSHFGTRSWPATPPLTARAALRRSSRRGTTWRATTPASSTPKATRPATTPDSARWSTTAVSTSTQLPQDGSPAIDTGTNDGCAVNDQREIARPQNATGLPEAICDIGAVEVLPEEEPVDPVAPLEPLAPVSPTATAQPLEPAFTG
ncbi:MAG: choice-of-anchor Q domain-containing protein [Acidimicrobiia bacterium]|nr:choice-of-anchor Q domain-containing protein [Acidimicrobiia bacterium]